MWLKKPKISFMFFYLVQEAAYTDLSWLLKDWDLSKR